MVVRMSANGDHPILLRGLSLHEADDSRPTLVQRSDIKFLDGLLADMTEGGAFRKLADKTINQGTVRAPVAYPSVPPGRGWLFRGLRAARANPVVASAPVKLYQPVHHTFHFVVLEAVCDLFPELGKAGQPQLDRDQIESAGLVIRRVNPATDVPEAWLADGNTLRGWIPLNVDELDEEMDPDPLRRPRRLGTGVPELDAQLGLDRRLAETLFETVEPLYVAPPDVCDGAGKTLLFGLIPTVSLEHSEAPDEELPPPRVGLDVLRRLFADYLTPGGGTRYVPLVRSPLGVDYYQAGQRERNSGDQFLSLLRWMNQLDALENPAALHALNDVTVKLGVDPELVNLDAAGPFERVTHYDDLGQVIEDYIQVQLGDLVEYAATTLRDSETDLTSQVTIPSGYYLNWRIPDTATSDAVLTALADRMQSRTTELKIIAGERRFDPRRGRYQARAFIRVQRDPDCPPELWWSEYSEVFQIAQHWDHNPDVPPAVIPLPDIPTRDTLKNLKPNVAFEVPEGLQNFLNANSPTDFFEGDPKEGSSVKLDILWICSFNIYIIMMIAFVILFAFAFMLNIVFNWLIFIRICLPIPVPTEE